MASKLYELPVTQLNTGTVATDLIRPIEDVLGFKVDTTSHLYLKPSSEKGTLLFIPKNRKLCEEKLRSLIRPHGESAECQLFNFSEKFREYIVNVLNKKNSEIFIRHYELLYNDKMCAVVGITELNELIRTCFQELSTPKLHPNNTIYGHVIVNLKHVEDVVLDQKTSSDLNCYLMDIKALEKEKCNPTIDIFRSSSISSALQNLISMQVNPAKLIDNFEWKEDMEGVKEQTSRIYLACKKSGFMKKEEEMKITFEKLHEKLESCVKNSGNQNLIEILIQRKDGSYSKELLLAGLILNILKTRKVAETEKIIFLFNQRIKDYLTRSLHLLYHLGFVNNDIDLLVQFGSKQTLSDLMPMMEVRIEYLHQMLLERCEEAGSFNEEEVTAKANKLCGIITKFELLSHPTNQEAKLVESEKVGTHHSMFVLYNYARITQILEKFHHFTTTGVYPPLTEISKTDFSLLALDAEWRLFVNYILKFPVVLSDSSNVSNSLLPNCISNICKFLISLSQDFSTYYSKTKILTQSGEHLYPRVFARIRLLTALRRVMDTCFEVLEIKPLEQI